MPINVAKELESRSAKAKGSRKSEEPEISEMRIKHAEGGHIVEHHMQSGMGEYHEPKTFVIKSHSQLKKHMDEHCPCGAGGAGGEEADASEEK